VDLHLDLAGLFGGMVAYDWLLELQELLLKVGF
jgi:hypothetical protein